ncbi:MAG: Transcription termination protein NusB, partial [uncultured Friedmanniella sp.]
CPSPIPGRAPSRPGARPASAPSTSCSRPTCAAPTRSTPWRPAPIVRTRRSGTTPPRWCAVSSRTRARSTGGSRRAWRRAGPSSGCRGSTGPPPGSPCSRSTSARCPTRWRWRRPSPSSGTCPPTSRRPTSRACSARCWRPRRRTPSLQRSRP